MRVSIRCSVGSGTQPILGLSVVAAACLIAAARLPQVRPGDRGADRVEDEDPAVRPGRRGPRVVPHHQEPADERAVVQPVRLGPVLLLETYLNLTSVLHLTDTYLSPFMARLGNGRLRAAPAWECHRHMHVHSARLTLLCDTAWYGTRATRTW